MEGGQFSPGPCLSSSEPHKSPSLGLNNKAGLCKSRWLSQGFTVSSSQTTYPNKEMQSLWDVHMWPQCFVLQKKFEGLLHLAGRTATTQVSFKCSLKDLMKRDSWPLKHVGMPLGITDNFSSQFTLPV